MAPHFRTAELQANGSKFQQSGHRLITKIHNLDRAPKSHTKTAIVAAAAKARKVRSADLERSPMLRDV